MRNKNVSEDEATAFTAQYPITRSELAVKANSDSCKGWISSPGLAGLTGLHLIPYVYMYACTYFFESEIIINKHRNLHFGQPDMRIPSLRQTSK